MKITSMSNRELYTLLTGNSYSGKSSGIKCPYVNKTTNDRFESSDSMVYEKSQSEGDKKSVDRFEYSDDIEFDDIEFWRYYTDRTNNALLRGAERFGSNIPTKEVIAEYFGNIAKRLDEAYAEGKFTKEEYAYINEGIAERMEHYTACAEDTIARRALLRKSMSPDYAKRFAAMTKAEFEDEVKDYIEKHCKIDRKALMQMFNNVRYGRNKPTEKIFVIKTSSAAAGNEKEH